MGVKRSETERRGLHVARRLLEHATGRGHFGCTPGQAAISIPSVLLWVILAAVAEPGCGRKETSPPTNRTTVQEEKKEQQRERGTVPVWERKRTEPLTEEELAEWSRVWWDWLSSRMEEAELQEELARIRRQGVATWKDLKTLTRARANRATSSERIPEPSGKVILTAKFRGCDGWGNLMLDLTNSDISLWLSFRSRRSLLFECDLDELPYWYAVPKGATVRFRGEIVEETEVEYVKDPRDPWGKRLQILHKWPAIHHIRLLSESRPKQADPAALAAVNHVVQLRKLCEAYKESSQSQTQEGPPDFALQDTARFDGETLLSIVRRDRQTLHPIVQANLNDQLWAGAVIALPHCISAEQIVAVLDTLDRNDVDTFLSFVWPTYKAVLEKVVSGRLDGSPEVRLHFALLGLRHGYALPHVRATLVRLVVAPDSGYRVRERAAQGLLKGGGQDPHVSRVLLAAVLQMFPGDDPHKLLKRLPSPDKRPSVSTEGPIEVADLLASLDPAAWRFAHAVLTAMERRPLSRDPVVRSLAAYKVSDPCASVVVDWLVSSLKGDRPKYRLAAAKCLLDLKPNARVQEKVFQAIMTMVGPEALFSEGISGRGAAESGSVQDTLRRLIRRSDDWRSAWVLFTQCPLPDTPTTTLLCIRGLETVAALFRGLNWSDSNHDLAESVRQTLVVSVESIVSVVDRLGTRGEQMDPRLRRALAEIERVLRPFYATDKFSKHIHELWSGSATERVATAASVRGSRSASTSRLPAKRSAGDSRALSQLRLAKWCLRRHNKERARRILQALQARFPESREAAEARRLLQSLEHRRDQAADNDHSAWRMWTRADGREQMEAVLIEQHGHFFTLRRRDGQLIILHREWVTEEDRKYLQTLAPKLGQEAQHQNDSTERESGQ